MPPWDDTRSSGWAQSSEPGAQAAANGDRDRNDALGHQLLEPVAQARVLGPALEPNERVRQGGGLLVDRHR